MRLPSDEAFATTLSCLKESTMPRLDNNTARFFGKIGYDLQLGDIADPQDEGKRLEHTAKGNTALVMGSHGALIVSAV